MLGMKTSQKLIVGVFLVACFFPQSSSLAVMREDSASNSTMSKSELQALVKVARARVQARMNKSGMVARWPFDSDPKSFWSGTYWNCAQTAVTVTEPVWSMIEGIGAVKSSCSSSDSKECIEASLGLSETLLAVLGYLMDFPTDCLGYTCGKEEDSEDRIHEKIFYLTMSSGAVDFGTAVLGIGAAGLGMHLQCGEKLGDSLGGPDVTPWIHPSLVSFAPMVKEIRETAQIFKSTGDTMWQKLEKLAALGERVAGTVQSVSEALMDKKNNEDPSDTSASAVEGCRAAVAHVAASVLALLGSIFKSVACYKGELELPHDIGDFGYKTEAGSDQKGKQDLNKEPSPSTNSKTVPISGGGMEEEAYGSGGSKKNQEPVIVKEVVLCNKGKDVYYDLCFPFTTYYDAQLTLGQMTDSGELCWEKCCDKKAEYTTAWKILASNYCKMTEMQPVSHQDDIYRRDDNMNVMAGSSKTGETKKFHRQKTVDKQKSIAQDFNTKTYMD